MKYSLLLAALAGLLFTSCDSTPKSAKKTIEPDVAKSQQDSIVTSFVFVGCNRLWWRDVEPETSSANVNVLTHIFEHVAQSKTNTDYFFFLGDIVNGESDVKTLESQLKHWNEDYDNGIFSDFKSTGIQLVAVPGNHEMLNQNETPLAGTTEAWLNYMGKYMPEDRDSIPNSPVDRMTYGFTHGNVGFIVLNTDTYNTIGGIGKESQFPYDWVKKQVAKYKADPNIDHVFVMGHRPFYTNCLNYGTEELCPTDEPHACIRNTTHSGIGTPEKSSPVWAAFEQNNVISMLSAHVHQYQRLQPNGKTYQLVAGNGGSPVEDSIPPAFFGYTRINIWKSGRVEMISEGYDAPARYNDPVKHPNWSQRDMLSDMRWYLPGAKNDSVCRCVVGE